MNRTIGIKPVRNEKNYRGTLKEIDTFIIVEPNSPKVNGLNVLAKLVENYESQQYLFGLS